MPGLERWFAVLVAALLATAMAVQIASILQESQTYDEGIYVAAGYSYWKTGDYRLNREHPPLAKLLAAIPLLFLDLHLPLEDPSWAKNEQVEFGQAFLYRNRMPADRILFASRCVTILCTALLGLWLALWTKARAGSVAALIALALFAFDPNVIAHGRYATNDLMLTLFAFGTVVLWDRAMRSGKPLDFTAAGIFLGAAIGTKYSGLFLLPALAILAAVAYRGYVKLAYGIPIVLAGCVAVLALLSHGDPTLVHDGIRATIVHSGGQLAYLFGMQSTKGWWWYFPAVAALKSPLGTLALIGVATYFAVRNVRALGDLVVLIVPIAVYAIALTWSRLDLGVRYLLPVYPFVFAFAGIVSARYVSRPLVAACLAAAAIESGFVFPNYLAFFNVAAGGPANGPRYLLDSNIDWGQDLKKLKWWLDARGTSYACLGYFGNVDPAYYGIDATGVSGYTQTDVQAKMHCYAAVSVNYLYGGDYIGNDALRWMRAIPPVDKVGYSIYIFDLRHGWPPRR
jgi:hypothetical protein